MVLLKAERGANMFARGWFGVIFLSLAIVGTGCQSSSTSATDRFWSESEGKSKQEVSIDGKPLQSFAPLARKLTPAVVNISTTQVVRGGRGTGVPTPFGEEDPFREFFERFFGEIPQREFKQHSLGSGFIVSKDGYIVTNHHVIENATEIKVILSDEHSFDAKVIGRDPRTDLALIKIKADADLPVAPLGNSDQLSVGDWVVAIGNPFGLGHTVTAGIVSAKGRIIGAGPYDSFVQTDASINPGNSGGPLFNLAGEVVGINTAIVAQGQGIGFAIPINLAKEVLPQLRARGKVTRGWLGVAVQKVTPELAQSFGLKESRGALVADVTPGGPADKAGIKRGDVIVEFDGKPIREMNELPHLVAITPVGKEARLKALRDGKEMSFRVVVGELKEERQAALSEEEPEDFERELGLVARELTSDMARHLGLRRSGGVIIAAVEPDSPADEAGLQRGDVIEEINRSPVRSLSDYQRAMEQARERKNLLILVRRGDNTIYTSIKVG
ncbi:MAG: DegQ family serine endoprotease [Candidatus Tectomicrobia bacterium]|uniref:Probable periplasmic serine endoprotease DegP-like n=1 Tax=Tectimicrobiota bacterium TaxID=2528274 RepID=A0A932CLZ6_UNCTE|nr:DegQ family serine endoprotease [Candidatus Tectomicrobia bacterium]